MNDAVFCVTTFSSEHQMSIFLIELSSPIYQFLKTFRAFFNDHFHHFQIIFTISCSHRIVDVFLETVVIKVCYHRQTSLSIFRVALIFIGFGDDNDFRIRHFFRNFYGVRKSRNSGTNYEYVCFYH